MKKRNSKKGFTLVELVIVIAVIAILAGVLIPTFGGVVDKAKDNAAMQEARNVYTEYLVDKAGAGTVEQNVYIEVESGKFVEVLAGKVVAQSNGKYIMATAPTESEKGNQVEKTPAAEGVAAVPYTNIWSGKAN